MPLQPIWKEISQKEYNKYAYIPPPENATLRQVFDAVFDYHFKFEVTKQIIIPFGMGLFEQIDYLNSNEPKQYKYFKKVGEEFFFYVGSEKYEEYNKLDNPKKTNIMSVPIRDHACGCVVATRMFNTDKKPFIFSYGKDTVEETNTCRLKNPKHKKVHHQVEIKNLSGKIVGFLCYNEGRFGRYIEVTDCKKAKMFNILRKDVFCRKCDTWHFKDQMDLLPKE